jgi:hypothetical protein
MASHAPIPTNPVDPATLAEGEDERIAAFDEAAEADAVEPVSPTMGARQQAFRLAEAAPPLGLLVGGTAAVLLGGAVGYWLGARRAQPPVREVKRAASKAGHAVELLPVAMHLLANPVVRALAIRILMRRLGH